MSILGKVVGFFTGGGARTVGDTAGQVNSIVERWKPNEASRNDMTVEIEGLIKESQQSARAMALRAHETWFDALVDGFNRLIRPLVTVWLCGGLIGWWQLPKPGEVDPVMMQAFWTVLVFWFGCRAVLKDIPNAIKAISG